MACVEHEWTPVAGVFADEALVEVACRRCPTVSMDTVTHMNPGLDVSDLLEDRMSRSPGSG